MKKNNKPKYNSRDRKSLMMHLPKKIIKINSNANSLFRSQSKKNSRLIKK